MGNIIGNKAFVGNNEAEKIYLGDTLVYEKGLLFSMPSYNNTIPYVNSFGAVTFTGGTDVDGWIGYDPLASTAQAMEIIPYSASMGSRFLITFTVKWIFPSNSSAKLIALMVNSDKVDSNGDKLNMAVSIGMDESVRDSDTLNYTKNGSTFLIYTLDGSKSRQFDLGCYVDTVSKRCYLGIFEDKYNTLDIAKSEYTDYFREYSNMLTFRMFISAFGDKLPTNAYKNIKIRRVSNINIESGAITYL